MAKSPFTVTKFTNPSGQEVWRLSGMLHGKRIRQNFKSRAEAMAERQSKEIEWLNDESEGQTVWTTLTHEQNRDAIAAVSLMKHSEFNKTLVFAVEYFLKHYKEAANELTVESAVQDYLDEKSREEQRGLITFRQERSIKMEINKFKDYFSGRIIGEVTAEEIKVFLNSPLGRSRKVPTMKTWNNRRGYLSTFFKYCFMKQYVPENPILQVQHYRLKKARGTAETLSAKDANAFMKFLEGYRGQQNKDKSWWGKAGCMVPYYALTLFAGIRPDIKDGEISKLESKHIRMDTGVIIIEPEISKVNEKRTIKIQPNLRKWLEKYPIEEYPIIPPRTRDMWVDIRKKKVLKHDVMRHTFISMTVGAFRSVGDASLQAGNSEAVIRKHYLDLKSVEEADQFWRIVPKGTRLPKTFEKKDGRYVAVKQVNAS